MKSLTKREKEIVELIVAGFTSKQISDFLEIDRKTVSSHRYNAMKKLSYYNVAELVSGWIRNQIRIELRKYDEKEISVDQLLSNIRIIAKMVIV